MSPIHMHRAAMRRYQVIWLGLLALIASSQVMWAQAATAGGLRRARCADCAWTRDSLRARNDRLLLRFDSLRREFEHERLSDKERERLGDEMHRVMMALEESMGEAAHAQALVAARSAPQVREFRLAPYMGVGPQNFYRTSGYLGVSFDGPSIDEMRRNERIIRFFDYPRIALVEPSSPAEEAGIVAGDTLLALNGADVRNRDISLTKLLVPQNVIRLRVRREGDRKDFTVIVKKAPDYVVSRAVPMAVVPPAAATPPVAPAPAGQVRVYGGGEVVRRRQPMPSMVGEPGAAGVGTIWIYNDGIAGAQVQTVTEGLGRAVGVKSGVLVIAVRPGTPAYRSGLRDGDVIRRVSGKSVDNVRELRAMLAENADEEGLKLTIVRERRNRELTLRWE